MYALNNFQANKKMAIPVLKARVAADPYDSVAWEQLLGEIIRGRKSDEQAAQLREVYEDLLSKFPTAVSW